MTSMSRIFAKRPSPAMIVACIALIVALGGTAWAVAANSVGTTQLKDGAVTKPKLASGAVGTNKVIDGSLLKQDFKAGQLAKGAISYDGQVAVDGAVHEVGRVNGVLLEVACGTVGGASILISRVNRDASHSFHGFGTKTQDGALSSVSVNPDINGGALSASSANAAELGVVVAATAAGAPVKWTRIDLNVIRGPSPSCNFHGMATPSSSVG
jgi:hypothetical protein